MGAWIETLRLTYLVLCCRSHPSWVRGLKPDALAVPRRWHCRTPRGCVDWNFSVFVYFSENHSRTPRGCVDWNLSRGPKYSCEDQVAPLVGAWIETHIHLSSLYDNMILPLLYICFLKGTIMLFAGHICTISRNFYSISFYKNGLRKYPSPCCHFQISADV